MFQDWQQVMEPQLCRSYVEHTWRKNICRNCLHSHSLHVTSCETTDNRLTASKKRENLDNNPKSITDSNLNGVSSPFATNCNVVSRKCAEIDSTDVTNIDASLCDVTKANFKSKNGQGNTSSLNRSTLKSDLSASDVADKEKVDVSSRINGYEQKTPISDEIIRQKVLAAGKNIKDSKNTKSILRNNAQLNLDAIPTNYSCKIIPKERKSLVTETSDNSHATSSVDSNKFSYAYSFSKLGHIGVLSGEKGFPKAGILKKSAKTCGKQNSVQISCCEPSLIGYGGDVEYDEVSDEQSHTVLDAELCVTEDERAHMSLALYNTRWNSIIANLCGNTELENNHDYDFKDAELLLLWTTKRFSNFKHCDNKSSEVNDSSPTSRNSNHFRMSLENLFDKITDDSLLSSIIDGFSMTNSAFDSKSTDNEALDITMAHNQSENTPITQFHVQVSDQPQRIASAYKVVDINPTDATMPYGIVDVTTAIPESYPMPGIPVTPAPQKSAKELRIQGSNAAGDMSSFGVSKDRTENKDACSVVEEMLKDKGSDAELKAAIKLLDDVWKEEESSLVDKIAISPSKTKLCIIPNVTGNEIPSRSDNDLPKEIKGTEPKSIYEEASLCTQSTSSDSSDSKVSYNKSKVTSSHSSIEVDSSSVDEAVRSVKGADSKVKGKRPVPSAPSIPPPEPPSELPKRSNSITEELNTVLNFSPIPEPTFRFVKTGGMGGFQPRPPTPDAGIYSPKLEDLEPTPLPTEFDENYGTSGSINDAVKQAGDSGGGIMSFFSKLLRRGRDVNEEATVSSADVKLMKSPALLGEEAEIKNDDSKIQKRVEEASSKTSKASKDFALEEEKSKFVATAFDKKSIGIDELMKSNSELFESKSSLGSASPKVAPRVGKVDTSDQSLISEPKIIATLPQETNITDKVILRNRQSSPKAKSPYPPVVYGKTPDFTRELEMCLNKSPVDRSSVLQDRREPKICDLSPPDSPGSCRDDRPLSMPPNMAPPPPSDAQLYLPPWESRACEKIELPQCPKARRSILGRITVSKKTRPLAPPPTAAQVSVKRTRSINETDISAPIPLDAAEASDQWKVKSNASENNSSTGGSSGKPSVNIVSPPLPENHQYEPVLPVEANKSATLKIVRKNHEGYLEPVESSRNKVGQVMTLDRQKVGQNLAKEAVGFVQSEERQNVGPVGSEEDGNEKKTSRISEKVTVGVRQSGDQIKEEKVVEKDCDRCDQGAQVVVKQEGMKKDAKKEVAKKVIPKRSGPVKDSGKKEDLGGNKEKILDSKGGGNDSTKADTPAGVAKESSEAGMDAEEREKILACQPIYEEIPYDDMYFGAAVKSSTIARTVVKPDTPPKLPTMSPQLNLKSQTMPRNVASRSQSLTANDRPIQTLQRAKVKPDVPKSLPNRAGIMERSFHESPIRGGKPAVAPKRPISEAPKDLTKISDKSPQERPKPEVPQTVPNRPKPVPRKKPQCIPRPLVDQYVPIMRPGSSFWCVPEERLRETFQLITESCFETLQQILREYDTLLFHNDPTWKNNDLRWKDFDIIETKPCMSGAFKAKLLTSKVETIFYLLPMQSALQENLFRISHINWLRVVATFSDNIPNSFLPSNADSSSVNVAVTQYSSLVSLSQHFIALQELIQINSNKYCQQFIFSLIQIFSAISFFLEHSIALPDIGLQDISVATIKSLSGKLLVIWPKPKPGHSDSDQNVCGMLKRIVQEMVLSYLSIDRKLPVRYDLAMELVNEMLSNDSTDDFPIARATLELCLWGPTDEKLREFINSESPEPSLDLWLETERFNLVNRFAKMGILSGKELSTVSDLYRVKFLLKSSGAGLVQVAGLLVKTQ